jgi:hypothetical protein
MLAGPLSPARAGRGESRGPKERRTRVVDRRGQQARLSIQSGIAKEVLSQAAKDTGRRTLPIGEQGEDVENRG